MGQTLGSLETDALKSTGDAAFVQQGGAQFVIDHAQGTFTLYFTNGRLTALDISDNWRNGKIPTIADPFGVATGTTEADIIAKRCAKMETLEAYGRHHLTYTEPSGTTWRYTFFQKDDRLREIHVKLSDAQVAALSAADPPVAHGGTSFDDAILDLAADEPSGAQNEEDFLLNFSCPADNGRRGMWREDAQRLVEHNGKQYDVLSLHCNMTGATRDLYFDVTSFFGKM